MTTVISAPAKPTSPAAVPRIGDLARVLNILDRLPAGCLPPDDRAFLEAQLLPAWKQRRQRLNERDAALRALTPRHLDASSWRVARRIADELAIYVERGSWRFDRDRGAPGDPSRAAMHRAMLLNGGKLPSRTTIWRALAGRAA